MFLLSLLLGGGGLIGGIAMLILRPALRAAAGKIARKVPAKVWIGLAIAAALAALVLWHNHTVNAAYDAGRADEKVSRDAQWRAAFDKMTQGAEMYRQAYESEAAKVSELTGEIHAQNLRRNAAAADDLRLRGPGRAGACSGSGGDPRLSASTGGPETAPAGRDDPGDRVPAGDRSAIVPWPWLVQRAEDFDELLSEVTAWRTWYDRQKAVHDDAVKRLRAEMKAVKPEFGQ